MSVMTVGSFHVSIKIVTSTCVLQVKVHVFPKTSIFIFSVWTIYFSLEDRYVRRLYSWNIEYNHLLFLKQIYPIYVHGFHGFSWISHDLHVFPWDFLDFKGLGVRSLWQPVAACGSLFRTESCPSKKLIGRNLGCSKPRGLEAFKIGYFDPGIADCRLEGLEGLGELLKVVQHARRSGRSED